MMDHQISDNFSITINSEKSLKKWRFFSKNLSCDSLQDWGCNELDVVYIKFQELIWKKIQFLKIIRYIDIKSNGFH